MQRNGEGIEETTVTLSIARFMPYCPFVIVSAIFIFASSCNKAAGDCSPVPYGFFIVFRSIFAHSERQWLFLQFSWHF